jgi:tetratricopeptide (TPR) repeat protein
VPASHLGHYLTALLAFAGAASADAAAATSAASVAASAASVAASASSVGASAASAAASAAAAAGLGAAREPSSLVSEPGWGIAFDHAGSLCFVDTDEDVVWCLDALGRPAALARGLHAHDLLVDPAGDLQGDELTWDAGWRRWRRGIWLISPAGQRREIFAPALEPAAGAGLLVDRRGNRYGFTGGVHDGPLEALYRLTADGRSALVAGGALAQADGRGSAAGFEAVRAARWGRDGALYLTDGAAVRRVALDGTVSTLARASPVSPGEPWSHLLGLDVGPDRIVAADYAGGRLLAIAPGGAISTLSQSDFGWAPTGVVAAGDSLYVLEHRSAGLAGRLLGYWGPHLRVQRLRAGHARTLASVGGSGRLAIGLLALVALEAGQVLAVLVVLAAVRWRKKLGAPSLASWKWLTNHVFHVVAAITLLMALLLFAHELRQAAPDAARLGILALILLVTALGSQLGPSLIDRIKKIGPLEMIERSPPSLRQALANIDLKLHFTGAELQGQGLSPSEIYAYEQADLQLSMIQYSGQEITAESDKQMYWERLTQVGAAALVRGDALRSISRLKLVQEQSNGRYEPAIVAFNLGVAYIKAAAYGEGEETRFERLAKAVKAFRTAISEAPDHYGAYFQLAYALLDLGSYGSAAIYNRKALEIRPQLASAKYNLAIALQKAGRGAEAWQALRSIVPADEGFQAAAQAARDDEDLAPFRDDPRFAQLALAQANPAQH